MQLNKVSRIRSSLYVVREILSSKALRRASWQDLRLRKDDSDSTRHLDGAISWLSQAQDQACDGGVSYGYDLKLGWRPAYPETTGYIITTFLNYCRSYQSRLTNNQIQSYRVRARRMAYWLATVQLDCGAFAGGAIGIEPKPTVFNTGQVLEGWCHAYSEFKDEVILECLSRAAQWLMSVQDDDGSWRKCTSPLTLQTPATYNVRSAAALLEAGILLDDKRMKSAAIKNFDWALTQQHQNGWFKNNCLTDPTRPLTHTIGYTLEGLLRGAFVLKNERYLSAVKLASKHLKQMVEPDGFLSGRFDQNWIPQASWSCLTGSSQLALVWFRLGRKLNEEEYTTTAARLLSFVSRTQKISPSTPDDSDASEQDGVYGGIKGSHPVWGGYDPFIYPNWAAKFFADALLVANEKSDTECFLPARC